MNQRGCSWMRRLLIASVSNTRHANEQNPEKHKENTESRHRNQHGLAVCPNQFVELPLKLIDMYSGIYKAPSCGSYSVSCINYNILCFVWPGCLRAQCWHFSTTDSYRIATWLCVCFVCERAEFVHTFAFTCLNTKRCIIRTMDSIYCATINMLQWPSRTGWTPVKWFTP